VADAEHVTQDVWLRAAGADLRDIGDLRAWLVTVTVAARRSYDIRKSAATAGRPMSDLGSRNRC
jgi:DNA-directed RNA polymerase specialized sigma24 family protein